MKISALKCKKCGYIIFSRNVHDFRDCQCGGCAIDGGRNYTKVSGNYKDIEMLWINVKLSDKQINDDYIYSYDKYGMHTEEEIKKLTKKTKKEK